MSYRDDAAWLARAVTGLLTTGAAASAPLASREVQAALVCRDTLLGAVRDLTGVLLRQTPLPQRTAPDLLVRSPVHALHAALRALPAATGRELSLTEALAVPAGPPVLAWQRAARAAVQLERYCNDQTGWLPALDAWSLARDLATFSLALPVLDNDLAATLPESTPGPTWQPSDAADRLDPAHRAPWALRDGLTHEMLQSTATELAAHTADLPAGAAHLSVDVPGPIRPVQHLADLPGGTSQLADLLHRRGSRLTAAEIRAAAGAVTYGVDLTVRALTAATSSAPEGYLPDAVASLREALPDLQQLLPSDLATLTPPAPGVLLLSRQIRTRLTALDGLHEALPHGPTAARHSLNQTLTQWAVTATPVLDAVHTGLRTAIEQQSLLTLRQDTERGPYAHLLWLPIPHDAAWPHPIVPAAGRAAAALHRAAASLSATSRSAGPPIVQRVAADANAAFAELTQALRARPAPAWRHPTRAAHPSLPSPGPPQRSH